MATIIRKQPSKSVTGPEEPLVDIKFEIYKFNKRPRPADKQQVLIISCFSEFGCESIGLLYCIPKILQQFPSLYVIAVGWYGREYLYRHLVDEFWETKEEFQWLRERCRAFHHDSVNLSRVEKALGQYGQVIASSNLGHICVGNICQDCNQLWGDQEYAQTCPACNSAKIHRSLFGDVWHYRKFAVQVPRPGRIMMKHAASYLQSNAVGIFARGRECYGRNLPASFYVNLIDLLEEMGFNPIWLGEKQSTQPCPVEHIVDFSRLSESRNLELTLAIVSQLEFTIQFWTASTRLASMMGTPWILFESADQIGGMGQEGLRIYLTTDANRKKLVVCQYLDIVENNQLALDLTRRSVDEIGIDNWETIFCNEDQVAKSMVENRRLWECRHE